MKKHLYLLLTLLLVMSSDLMSQTLVAGDIAFIGVNEDPGPTAGHDHSFSWIALKDIPAGEVIYFTDQGVNINSNTWFGNTENHYRWTSPAGGISCGTIIYIYEDGSTNNLIVVGGGSMSSLLVGSGWNLSSGDQVLAYYASSAQSSIASTTFIAGIHLNDDLSNGESNGWTSTSYNGTGVAECHVPPGLTDGVNCISLHSPSSAEHDNNKYTGTLTGTTTALRALINTPYSSGNWYGDNGTNATVSITPASYSPSVTCVATAGSWDGSTSTDWNTASNWTGNVVPSSSDNITIPSAPSNQPHVTLAPGSPAVCNNITIDAGATLTVDAGKALTVSGDIDNDGTIIVKADAAGIGSLIDNGTITGSGSFQMEQYMTGSGGATPDGVFYYVSSPIPNATAATYDIASGNKLWIDDEPSQSYPQLTFGSIPLEVGQGYIARMGSSGATTFNGSSFNTGNITEGSLTRTGTTELNRGYNLVGNPYPSTVNWNTASKTNLETSIWFRTHDGSGNMLFDTYNTTGNIGTNNNGNGDVTNLIPPTQAVWVRVDADGNTGQLDFDNADRSHGAWSGLYKTEAQDGLVRIALSDGNSSDEAIVIFDAAAQDAFDDYDSHKFWASNVPQLYMNVQEDTLVINGLFSTLTSPSVPIGVKLPSSGNFSINASNITVTGESVHLEDTYLNIFQDLNLEPDYSFSSSAGNIGDRFILHFGMTVGIGDEADKKQSFVYVSAEGLIVAVPESSINGTIDVLDMAGRVTDSSVINATRTVLPLDVPTGVYLVRIHSTNGTDVHRIILQ